MSYERPISRALISVSDKTGLIPLARALVARGAEILSTGGTAERLRADGIPVVGVSDFTGFPEILGGRVKTLHPKLFGGILAVRSDREHQKQMAENNLAPIDLVVVNLYPFAATVARADVTQDEAIEQIDIGGPSLLRASAKNHHDVAVVVDPADYETIIRELEKGGTTLETRFRLAKKVFSHTARYDAMIYQTLESRWTPRNEGDSPFPEVLIPAYVREQTLRYGENPHQSAAFYREDPPVAASFASFRQLQGKELSYNNILDSDSARALVLALPKTSCAVVKHNNPCGAGTGESVLEALERAWAGDPVSAFGGIVAFNVPVDEAAARWLAPRFVEVVLAPGFEPKALEAFAGKKNVRLLEIPPGRSRAPEVRAVDGGLLVQHRDALGPEEFAAFSVVTQKSPSPEESRQLELAWMVAAAVKSNAIVIAKDGRILGVGAGQMSRVDSCRLAIEKARAAGSDTSGAVAASDAFFPFPDGLLILADGGVTAVAHPGGSIRDAEVTAAADERGIAIVQTGRRHFRH